MTMVSEIEIVKALAGQFAELGPEKAAMFR